MSPIISALIENMPATAPELSLSPKLMIVSAPSRVGASVGIPASTMPSTCSAGNEGTIVGTASRGGADGSVMELPPIDTTDKLGTLELLLERREDSIILGR